MMNITKSDLMQRSNLMKDYYYSHIETLIQNDIIISSLKLKFNYLMQAIEDYYFGSDAHKESAKHLLDNLNFNKTDESLRLRTGSVRNLVHNCDNWCFTADSDNDSEE